MPVAGFFMLIIKSLNYKMHDCLSCRVWTCLLASCFGYNCNVLFAVHIILKGVEHP